MWYLPVHPLVFGMYVFVPFSVYPLIQEMVNLPNNAFSDAFSLKSSLN